MALRATRARLGIFQKIKEAAVFLPDMKTFVNGPKTINPRTGEATGYRWPSPGSGPKPNVPELESSDRMYRITHYDRDTVRSQKGAVILRGQKDGQAAIESSNVRLLSRSASPGNANPDVMKYDPSGLRTTMTANQDALDAALASRQPTHLCKPLWAANSADIIAEYEAKGLPAVPGRPSGWTRMPVENTGSW